MNTSHKKSGPLLIIGHDAGGAEILAAYLVSRPKASFVAYAAGPAQAIFLRVGVAAKGYEPTRGGVQRIIDENAGARMLLTETGWRKDVGITAIRAARRGGMRTAAYLDSWVLFKERFGYPRKGWRDDVADEVWVGDEYALALARKAFPSDIIRFEKNRYFEDLKKRSRSRAKGSAADILFVSDTSKESGVVLTELAHLLAKAAERRTLRIRLHPSDIGSRYDALAARYAGKLKIEISSEPDLADDLSRSIVVTGVATLALAAAAICGKRVIAVGTDTRTIPKIPGILRVRDAAAAARRIAAS